MIDAEWERRSDDEVRAQARTTLREIRQEIDYLGNNMIREDPHPTEPIPPPGVVYPSLIRARFVALFDRAEDRGLPRNARLALEVFCTEMLELGGRRILDEAPRSGPR